MFILEKDLKFPEANFLSMTNQPYEMKESFSMKRVCQWWEHYHGMVYVSFSGGLDSCVLAFIVCQAMMKYWFSEIWNSTITKQNLYKYGWNANPYVWVIRFKKISKEEAYDRAN